MAVVAMVGSRVERVIGSLRFAARLRRRGARRGGVAHRRRPYEHDPAHRRVGSLFAVLAVAGALFGSAALAFMAVLVVANIVQAFGGPGDVGVAFGAHLGGLCAGVLFVVLAHVRGMVPSCLAGRVRAG